MTSQLRLRPAAAVLAAIAFGSVMAQAPAPPAPPAPAPAPPPAACTAPEYRAFDFWVGDWSVGVAGGKAAGTNHITREYGGCVVHEHYDTGKGYSGESLNIYDSSRKLWHQSWVDSTGLLLLLDGGIRDGKMVLEGQIAGPDGKATKHRITWTPNQDGSVRQLWESTDASGAWTVAFDGRYTRR